MRRLLLALFLVSGCSSPTMSLREDEHVERPSRDPLAPFEECVVTTYREAALSRNHVAPCSDLPLQDFPPVGGDHYGVWANWGTYDAPIPWGFLIHAMEHGAVVLAYRCDESCPEVVSELQSIGDAIFDPLCRGEDVMRRVIVVPMPDLEVAVAALAWEHAYLATCLDPTSLEAWVDAHYGMGREDLCRAGVDLSADGWCP